MSKTKSNKQKITVYDYWEDGKHLDSSNGMRTQKDVEAREGSIIAGSAKLVDESDLDEDGRYFRKFD